MQVLRLGAPIVAFSLSPNQELLATVHVNHRGIYLWANQTIFGQDAADVMPSDSPIDARLPQLDAGRHPVHHMPSRPLAIGHACCLTPTGHSRFLQDLGCLLICDSLASAYVHMETSC